jgi:hypothetical protein
MSSKAEENKGFSLSCGIWHFLGLKITQSHYGCHEVAKFFSISSGK